MGNMTDLATIGFSTLGKCQAICSEILKNPIGYKTNTNETRFISTFLSMYHPDWSIKTKDEEVLFFEIRKADKYTKCFYLITKSGYSTDISFRNGVRKNNYDSDSYKRRNICAASRNAIDPIISSIRKDAELKIQKDGFIRSEYSNAAIYSIDDIDIDHYDLSFDELIDKWISIKGLDYLYSKVNMNEQNSTITRYVDDEMIKEFVVLHNSNTHLRVVSREENRSTLKKL